ncbi:hypothetical protein BDV96DRAFT_668709 [Lophiotrema nucula]|uniref:Uncharacterized protein n=1 Tax=Lophiotrema nucula TaxID=690887 RepID=A0A6A5YVP6_9PLEO|nr:hypothetical protein BDV96DRAFT_668709 [Lophiotrema nucula]
MQSKPFINNFIATQVYATLHSAHRLRERAIHDCICAQDDATIPVPGPSDHLLRDTTLSMEEVGQVQVDSTGDQHPFQPVNDFRQEHETHSTLDFPAISKLGRFKQDTDPTHPETQSLPNGAGGISLPSQRHAAFPARTPKGTYLLASPGYSKPANVGVRRAQKASLLLGSPARPGHASRMKQMFADATTENRAPKNDGVVLYPQLPNVSRTCNPVEGAMEEYRPATPDVFCSGQGSPLPPTYDIAVPNLRCLRPAESPVESSGSWSGDSSYLTVENPPRRSSPGASTEPRINEWLSTILSDDQASGESTADRAHHARNEIRHDAHASESNETIRGDSLTSYHDKLLHIMNDEGWSTSSSSSADSRGRPLEDVDSPSHTLLPWSPNVPHTPVGAGRRVTEPWSPLDDPDPDSGGVALSPLSPNVCVERGPSRRYSLRHNRTARGARKLGTPTRAVAVKDDNGPQSAKTLRALGKLDMSGGVVLGPVHQTQG